jgi:hypothetical protein
MDFLALEIAFCAAGKYSCLLRITTSAGGQKTRAVTKIKTKQTKKIGKQEK